MKRRRLIRAARRSRDSLEAIAKADEETGRQLATKLVAMHAHITELKRKHDALRQPPVARRAQVLLEKLNAMGK